MEWFPMHDFVKPCIDHLENIGLPHYSGLQMLTDFFLYVKESYLLITASLTRKVSICKVFNFCLKAHILSLATNTAVFLPISG